MNSGECILDLTHLPIGGKTSNKCKADILLNAKHRSINLFLHKRVAGMQFYLEESSTQCFSPLLLSYNKRLVANDCTTKIGRNQR